MLILYRTSCLTSILVSWNVLPPSFVKLAAVHGCYGAWCAPYLHHGSRPTDFLRHYMAQIIETQLFGLCSSENKFEKRPDVCLNLEATALQLFTQVVDRPAILMKRLSAQSSTALQPLLVRFRSTRLASGRKFKVNWSTRHCE